MLKRARTARLSLKNIIEEEGREPRNPLMSNVSSQQDLDSDSSSDNIISTPKKCKRPISPTSSEASDTNTLIFPRSRKRMRILSSSDSSSSENLTVENNLNSSSEESRSNVRSYLPSNQYNQNNGKSSEDNESQSEDDESDLWSSDVESDFNSHSELRTNQRFGHRETTDEESHQELQTSFAPAHNRKRDRTRRRNIITTDQDHTGFLVNEGNSLLSTTHFRRTQRMRRTVITRRRVIGRRSPVIESEEESDLNTLNNNEQPRVVENVSGAMNAGNLRERFMPRNVVLVPVSNQSLLVEPSNSSSSSLSSSSPSSDIYNTQSLSPWTVYGSDSSAHSSLDYLDSDSSDDSISITRRGHRIPIPNEDFTDEEVNEIEVINIETSDTDSESEKCPICFVSLKNQLIGKPASCDHMFCSECIKEWAKRNNNCPVDRKVFNRLVEYRHGVVIRDIEVPNVNQNLYDDGDFEELRIVLEMWRSRLVDTYHIQPHVLLRRYNVGSPDSL